jgi:hypothetical protein
MANPNPSPATRFKPGNTANPGGRPRDVLSRELREALTPEDRKAIIGTLLAFAKAGKIEHIREVFDRVEGKAIARQEQGDPGAFTGLEDVPTEELVRRIEEYRKLK